MLTFSRTDVAASFLFWSFIQSLSANYLLDAEHPINDVSFFAAIMSDA